MALKGEPGKALFIGSFSSLVGGLVSGVALILISVPLSDFGSIVFVCSDYTKYPRILLLSLTALCVMIQKNRLINPITTALFIGITFGVLPVQKPKILLSILTMLANCMSPVAMVTTGVIIGSYSIFSIVQNWRSYIYAAYRLVLFPFVLFAIFRLLDAPTEIYGLALCCFATPAGLNCILVPSAYNHVQSDGASLVAVSQLLSIITLPLLAEYWVL